MESPSLFDRSPTILAVCFTGISLQILALILRFWSRKVNRTPFWHDDWTVLAACPLSIGICVECIYYVFHCGYGKPAAILHRPSNWPVFSNHDYVTASFVSGQLYNTAITLVKLSALLFYGRVFGHVRTFRIALWVVACTSVLWDFAFTIKGFAQRDWRNGAESFDSKKVTFIASTFSNLIIDVIILVLPHPILWGMKLSRRKKMWLVFAFLSGYWCVLYLHPAILSFLKWTNKSVSVVGISVYRAVTMALMPTNNDLGYNAVPPSNAIVIEVPVAITSVSLPAIFPLFKRAYRYGASSLFSAKDYASDSQTRIANSTGPRSARVTATKELITRHNASFAHPKTSSIPINTLRCAHSAESDRGLDISCKQTSGF